MAGAIKRMLASIVEQRSRANPMLARTTQTKLILKGLNPAKFTDSSPDDSALIARVLEVAAELEVALPATEMRARVAQSQRLDAREAVEEIRAGLHGLQPRLVVYFASTVYDPAEVSAAMQHAFAPAAVIGCTSAGEIISGAMLKQSVVAFAAGAAVVDDVHVELLGDLRGTADPVPGAFAGFARHFGTPMMRLDPTKYVGLVLADGLCGAEERLMDRLGNLTDVAFVGGSAGDDLHFKAAHVFAHGRPHRHAAVLAVLRAERGFGIVKTQSFTTLGKKLVATRVRLAEREVVEFDGRPAARAYAEALGISVERLPDLFMSHPLGLMAGEEPFVRSPQRVAQDGSVRFYCATREGMELEVLRATDIVSDTRRALDAKRQEMGSISGILNFNCVLRTLELEKKGQTGAYARLFTELPTAGFSTYGEAYLGHVNQTATMLVLP